MYIAAHSIDSSDIAGSDATRARQLASDALQSAATVRYARDANFATSNGPIDVISTVERFASSTGAAHSYGIDVHALDAFPQAVPLATGTLGDASHADSVVRTTSSGFQAVQITVEWRLANVVNILVVRGRYGGARLVDALTLAHREATNEIR